MIFESLIQSLALLLPLRESLLPTRIRQQCRRVCVGFIPMVFSPIGFHRFRFETLQILLRSFCEFDFSKLITRFQTRIWNPGDNGSDYKEYRIENRLWPDLTHLIFDEDEPRRWSLHSPVWVLVYIGSCAVSSALLSDLKKRVTFNPNDYSQIHNRLIIRCIHIVYRRSLVFDQYFILLEILSTHFWWYWKLLFWSQIWVIRQRRLTIQ